MAIISFLFSILKTVEIKKMRTPDQKEHKGDLATVGASCLFLHRKFQTVWEFNFFFFCFALSGTLPYSQVSGAEKKQFKACFFWGTDATLLGSLFLPVGLGKVRTNHGATVEQNNSLGTKSLESKYDVTA
jgi:hypothetical protein